MRLSRKTVRETLAHAYNRKKISPRSKEWREFKELCRRAHVTINEISLIDYNPLVRVGRTAYPEKRGWWIEFYSYTKEQGLKKLLSLSRSYKFEPLEK